MSADSKNKKGLQLVKVAGLKNGAEGRNPGSWNIYCLNFSTDQR
jgi:hypothetical protein